MRKYILQSAILLLISLVGCKEFKLSTDDLKWQPYEVDDILVFESNTGEVDSIKIKSIDSYLNPKDPLAVFPNEHEVLFVNGKLLNLNKDYKNWNHVNLLNLTSSKETWMTFNLNKMSDSLQYAEAKYSVDQLNEFYGNKKLINDCIKDIIELKPNYTGGLDYEYDLKTYWWSKKYGYIRYSFKNGYYRELKKFIRNGKNILPKCSND